MAIDEGSQNQDAVSSSFQQEEQKDPNISNLSISPAKSTKAKTLEGGGIVGENFFGQLNSFIKYRQGEEFKEVEKKSEPFAEILLNVIGLKDIYEAWERMYEN